MAIIKVKRMFNEGVDVFKLETPYPDKEERYMAYNGILFNMVSENMKNPLIVTNEANTGGFIILGNGYMSYVLEDIIRSFASYGYEYREYNREANDKGLTKINFEIRPLKDIEGICNMNICQSPELAPTRPNNGDRIHVMDMPKTTVGLIEAIYNHGDCIGKRDRLFHTLMMFDEDKKSGMFITQHTRTGCINKRLREDFGFYGKILFSKDEDTFYSHGDLIRVTKFEIEDSGRILDLGLKDISIKTEIKCPRD